VWLGIRGVRWKLPDGTSQTSLVGVIVASTQSYQDEAKVIQSLSAPDINHYDPMKWARNASRS
jgi:hypothetical protein